MLITYNRYFSSVDTLYKIKNKKVQPVNLKAKTKETSKGNKN